MSAQVDRPPTLTDHGCAISWPLALITPNTAETSQCRVNTNDEIPVGQGIEFRKCSRRRLTKWELWRTSPSTGLPRRRDVRHARFADVRIRRSLGPSEAHALNVLCYSRERLLPCVP
jgi:hypothetical protein